MKNSVPKGVIIIFLLAGLGLLIAGILVQNNSKNFAQHAKEATATITQIDYDYHTDSDGDTTTNYTVYVEFEVDGKTYSGRLGFYSAGMYEGGTVTVLYDIGNPQNFRSKSGDTFIYILLVLVGIAVMAIGLIFFLNSGKNNKQKTFLMQSGKKVLANVTNIVPGNIAIRGRVCYNIICEYSDASGSETHSFKSDNIWVDFPPIDENQTYPQIAVYVDINDWRKYYVDFESWFNEF